MAVTGTGTQADPYMVHTYDELCDTAKTSETYTGTYIKIANNIDITNEYPNGDMPVLNIEGKIIDGNNKKISNWYTLTNSYNLISFTGQSQIHDCIIGNIYTTGTFITFRGGISGYHIVDCDIYGVVHVLFDAVDDYGSTNNFLRCSLNLKGSNMVNNSWSYVGMLNCNIRFMSTSGTGMFNTSRSTFVRNCYIETNAPVGAYDKCDNCACDITTTQTLTYNNGTNALNIFNATHAPNITANGSYWAGVPNDKWLDVSFLSSIGFNAG